MGGVMFLDYVALFLLIFVALVMFYGIIAIHDIPYEIAKKRNHPHLEMFHVAIMRRILLRMSSWENYLYLDH